MDNEKAGETSDNFENEVIKFSESIKLNAAQIGHDNWLVGSSAILGFPNKDKYDTYSMRCGAMPYKLMQLLEKRIQINEDNSIEISMDHLEFKKIYFQYMKELGFTDEIIERNLIYVNSITEITGNIPEENLYIFNSMIKDAALKRIHDNDTWGKAAEAFLQIYGINLSNFENRHLKFDFVLGIQEAIENIPNVSTLKTSNDFDTFFEEFPSVRNVMLAAHHSWRMREYGKKVDGEIKMHNENVSKVTIERVRETTVEFFASPRINLMTAIYGRKLDSKRIQELVHELRNTMHMSTAVSTEESFTLMLTIAEDLELRVMELQDSADYEEKSEDLKILNATIQDLLGTITYDANLAIPESLKKTYEDMNGKGSFPVLLKI